MNDVLVQSMTNLKNLDVSAATDLQNLLSTAEAGRRAVEDGERFMRKASDSSISGGSGSRRDGGGSRRRGSSRRNSDDDESRLNEHRDCDHLQMDDYRDCRKETKSASTTFGPQLAVAAAGLLYTYLL